MHDCPRCGQACTCSGDIDDNYVVTEEWAFLNCKCDCEDEDDLDQDEMLRLFIESDFINDDPTGEEKAPISSYWPEYKRVDP